MIAKTYLLNFLIVVAGILLGSYVFSIFSGWRKLAEYYKANKFVPNKLSKWKTGSIGNIFMQNCLNIGTNESGLFLSTFGLFFPSLLIPWDAVTKVHFVKKEYFNTIDYCNLQIGNPPITKISLPRETLAEVEHILATKH